MPAETETHFFPDDGETPNHPELPLVIMHGTAAADAEDPAAWFEQRFTGHGWGSTWRWGVYRYHHFHSNNHEVLGVARGSARLMLGGAKGKEFGVDVGDVIVIPAGVAHKCLDSSDDFMVVGAYPRGEKPDLTRSGEGDIENARRRIAEVPLPAQDPVHGSGGPLLDAWQSGQSNA